MGARSKKKKKKYNGTVAVAVTVASAAARGTRSTKIKSTSRPDVRKRARMAGQIKNSSRRVRAARDKYNNN